MKKSFFALQSQELNVVGGGCRELKERHLAVAVLLTAASPWLPGTHHPTFLDGRPINKPTSIEPAALGAAQEIREVREIQARKT